MRVVAKIGTSSITNSLGVIDNTVVDNLCEQMAALRAGGHEVILVSSGAVSAGVAALGLHARPTDMPTLLAISAAGQSRLMETYNRSLARHQLVAAQVASLEQGRAGAALHQHRRGAAHGGGVLHREAGQEGGLVQVGGGERGQREQFLHQGALRVGVQ